MFIINRKAVIGWLSNNGVFHECETYEHNELAINLVTELKLQAIEENGVFYTGAGLLEKLGWFRFTQSPFYEKYEDAPDNGYVYLDMEKMISYEQLKWYRENKCKLSKNQINVIEEYLAIKNT